MFKKCKENQCLNRQMVQFFVRQFNFLKQIAANASELDHSITSQRISQSVQLMQKRILFVLDEKPTQQFHDYISDFYEAKLQKLSKDLNKQLKRSKLQQEKMQQMLKSLKIKQQAEFRSKPLDFTTINQNMSLKSQLIHSKNLLVQNQEIMQEQNKAIEEMNNYIIKLEQKQRESREQLLRKIKQLNEIINEKKRHIIILVKQFQNEHKRLQKQYKQISMQNILFLQQKDRLQNQIVMKTEEIKLLTKKIYDQSLILNKFERTLNHNEGILMQQKIQNNRSYDENRLLRDKIKNIEGQYQLKLLQKHKLLNQLQQKLNKNVALVKQIQNDKINLQNVLQKCNIIIKNMQGQIKKLEQQINQKQQKQKQNERQFKKYERKQKQRDVQIKQLQQFRNQRQKQLTKSKQIIGKLRKELEFNRITYQQQKQLIKKDIDQQFNKLVCFNKQILTSLNKKEEEFIKINHLYTQCLLQKKSWLQMNDKLSEAFEDAKKKLMRIQQEKDDEVYSRKQLQLKVQNLQRQCEQYQNYEKQYQLIKKNAQQIQLNYIQCKKIIKQKESEVETFKKILKQQHNSYNSKNKQNIQSFKQESNKRQFLIKQLHSKINILQEQLRQNQRNNFNEKQKMKNKIKQLQQIIQERFDISNRIIDLSIQ